MEILRFLVHYGMHFIVPGAIAYIFFRDRWRSVWLIFLLSMIVDIDHLWATPIYSPDRFSIGFHTFHSYVAIGVYFLLLLFRRFRVIAIALLFHMFTDCVDWLLHNTIS